MIMRQFSQLLSIGLLVGMGISPQFTQLTLAQTPNSAPNPVQPSVSYDEIGIAQYQNQTLRLKTFVWEVKESKEEKEVVTTSLQTRKGRKPYTDPKTGKQDMVDYTYELPVPMKSTKEFVTKTKTGNKSIVKDYKPTEFSVSKVDGGSLKEEELVKNLASARTVLVFRSRYLGEPNPQFSDLFRGMLHPGLLIVRVPWTEADQPKAEPPRQNYLNPNNLFPKE